MGWGAMIFWRVGKIVGGGGWRAGRWRGGMQGVAEENFGRVQA